MYIVNETNTNYKTKAKKGIKNMYAIMTNPGSQALWMMKERRLKSQRIKYKKYEPNRSIDKLTVAYNFRNQKKRA